MKNLMNEDREIHVLGYEGLSKFKLKGLIVQKCL